MGYVVREDKKTPFWLFAHCCEVVSQRMFALTQNYCISGPETVPPVPKHWYDDQIEFEY